MSKKLTNFLRGTLHQSYFLVALSLGVLVGTLLGLILKINFFASPLWPVFAVLLFIFTYFKPKTLLLAVAFLAGTVLSFFRIASELQGETYIKTLESQTVVVTGTLSQDPSSDEEKGTTKFALTNLTFGDENEKHETKGTLYVSLRQTDDIQRGDQITLKGKLNPGFGTYAGYLYQPTVQKIARPDPGDPILNLRNWFANHIKQSISEITQNPEDQEEPTEDPANLALSYLLGMKTGLSEDLSDNLRVVGLVHIVVASGAHLSILVSVAKNLFGKLSRFAAFLASSTFTLVFMSLVGWTPSILRAGLMTLMTTLTWYVGRKIAPWRLILLTAATTLLINPMNIQNLGWLLSFASFSGIMLLGPKITKFFFAQKKPNFVASTVITTLSATLLTLPITLYYYGTLSLISLLANLLILPTLPYAMGLAFATGVTTLTPIAWLTEKLLNFHINTVSGLASAKFFLIEIDPYNPAVFALYALIIIPLISGLFRKKVLKLRQKKRNRRIKNMSGHSKWATTKRQKAVVDAKRGALFTKIGNQIAIAARQGTDPNMNPSLAMVLEKARLANMPKANIERAIARVADKSAAALIEETYEAYGPGGVGIVIEVATDNKNRTMPEVRHTLDKNGGRMADPGSVMFQFSRKGVIEISEKSEDALMQALDAGAEDATEEDDGIMIYTAPSDLMKVRQTLVDNGLTVTTAELQYVPTAYVPVDGDNAEKLEKLLAAIDDLDDVTNVYTNAE